MKKTFLDLLKFVQRTGGFMTSDLKRIMTANKQSVTDANVQGYLYLFQVLSRRRYNKSYQKGGHRYYTVDQQVLNDMLQELRHKDIRVVWASKHLDKNNMPTDQIGLASLLM